MKLREDYRFFHFGIGYEIEGREQWNRIYINPGFSIDGNIEVRGRIPWTSQRSNRIACTPYR